MTDQTEEHATASVEVEATPDQVWQALTTPDGLAPWMGDDAEMGDQAGDDLALEDPVTGERKLGRVEEVLPGERLRYRWWPEADPDNATSVAITLVPYVSGTRVTVIESRPLPKVSARAQMCSQMSAPTSLALGADWHWRTAMLSLAIRRTALTPIGRW